MRGAYSAGDAGRAASIKITGVEGSTREDGLLAGLEYANLDPGRRLGHVHDELRSGRVDERGQAP